KYTKEDNERARQLFETAIRLDPTFVRAHANVAATYRQEWTFVWTKDLNTSEQQALQWAQQALDLAQQHEELKSSLPYAYQQLANVHMNGGELDLAIDMADKAVKLEHQYADGYAALAQMLIYNGQPLQALAHMEVAKSLNPKPPAYYHYHIGQAYYVLALMNS